MQTILTNFSEAPAAKLIRQEEILEFISICHEKADSQLHPGRILPLLQRFGVKPQQVSHRSLASMEASANLNGIYERNLYFQDAVNKILLDFYPEGSQPPSHLLHVTCTGYVSPSPAQSMVNAKQWSGQTNITHAYHMGCYASMPAIRMAHALLESGEKSIDIVHTEMCSLHLNPKDHSPEQLVVQSLFGDGHIKYTATKQPVRGMALLCVKERLVPDSREDMSWMPADWGMKMTLSREVPQKIASQLKDFVVQLAGGAGLPVQQLLQKAIFAVHPGGPKIIESVQSVLGLSEEQVYVSKQVLFDRGNMSSATLPHIWLRLKDELPGTFIVSLAFGPGLTIFGAVFELVAEK